MSEQPRPGRAHAALDEALQRLNPEQRAAVERTEGPVMVIAGPGTGKTQILASRIGHILRERDAQPENVLCLTYTDAGVVAMRQRLQEFIGPAAHRVAVYTFHSFCNLVIQQNPDRFGFRDGEPVADLDARILLEELIDALPTDNPLKRLSGSFRGAYFEVDRLLDLVRKMKQEDLPADALRRRVREWVDGLPDHPDFQYKRKYREFKAGDPKPTAIEKETKDMATLLAAVDLAEAYNARLREKGWYDFDDMIRSVLEAFGEDAELLRDYQERFLYVLVDEFQDTNSAQNHILERLVSYWESPNVFAVGDDDQAIYRFQGANLENIVGFARQYADAGLHNVVLKTNYRSSQVILDSARALIGHNTGRLVGQPGMEGLDKTLVAGNAAVADLDRPVRLVAWHNEAQEVVGTARAIEALVREGEAENRTLGLAPTDPKARRPSDIAVIYRKHAQAEALLAYLQRRGVPVRLKRREDLFASPFITELLRIFSFLDAESRLPYSADDQLFDLLQAPWTGIRPRTVAGLSWTLRRSNDRRGQKPVFWRGLLGDAGTYGSPEGDLFHPDDAEQLGLVRETAERFETWIGAVRLEPLQGLFERVFSEGGILRWVMGQPDKVVRLEELNTLFDLVKRETARRPDLGLESFMERVANYRQHGVRLPVDRSLRAEDGVFFTTAHGAKGLEFRHVFVIGATDKAWSGKGNNRAYKLPPILAGAGPDEGATALEEERRLFFVAMTRAERDLVIGWPRQTNDGKELNECRYVAEVADSGLARREGGVVDEGEALAYWEAFVEPHRPERRGAWLPGEREHVRQRLEHFQLSVTHLNKYLRCPLSFYYESILKVPAAKNRAMTFGTSVHHALEQYVKAMLTDPDREWPSAERLLDWFDNAMHRHREAFAGKQYALDRERGHAVLRGFLDARRDGWSKDARVEIDLSKVLCEGVPLRGKLDRVSLDGNDVVTVFDYKTGKYRKEKFEAPEPGATEQDAFEKREGGDYWRQAVFYKILVDRDRGPQYGAWRAHEAIFEFVEPENDGSYRLARVPVTEDDVATVSAQIRRAWDGIHALDFARGCGEEWCRWCAFERTGALLDGGAEGPDEVEER
jgi:DNA helicase-2/ATP-dependent DNA helicase PcrA